MEDLSPYRGTLEPPTVLVFLQAVPKPPLLPQHKDEIEAVLDDETVASSHGGFQWYLVKWRGRPDSDATWISEDEFRAMDPELLGLVSTV